MTSLTALADAHAKAVENHLQNQQQQSEQQGANSKRNATTTNSMMMASHNPNKNNANNEASNECSTRGGGKDAHESSIGGRSSSHGRSRTGNNDDDEDDDDDDDEDSRNQQQQMAVNVRAGSQPAAIIADIVQKLRIVKTQSGNDEMSSMSNRTHNNNNTGMMMTSTTHRKSGGVSNAGAVSDQQQQQQPKRKLSAGSVLAPPTKEQEQTIEDEIKKKKRTGSNGDDTTNISSGNRNTKHSISPPGNKCDSTKQPVASSASAAENGNNNKNNTNRSNSSERKKKTKTVRESRKGASRSYFDNYFKFNAMIDRLVEITNEDNNNSFGFGGKTTASSAPAPPGATPSAPNTNNGDDDEEPAVFEDVNGMNTNRQSSRNSRSKSRHRQFFNRTKSPGSPGANSVDQPRASRVFGNFYKKIRTIGAGAFASTWLIEWKPRDVVKALPALAESTNQNGTSSTEANIPTVNNNQTPPNNNIGTESEIPSGKGLVVASGQAMARNHPSSKKEAGGGRSDDDDQHERSKGSSESGSQQKSLAATSSSGTHQKYNPEALTETFNSLLRAPPISYLASTKPKISVENRGTYSRDNVFVCKVEPRSTGQARSTRSGGGELGEARLVASCAHPNIVAYIDEFTDDQNNYLVTEYVDGNDLREALKSRTGVPGQRPARPMSEEQLLFIFVQICLGLEYLHRNNILHRDLKPANILLSKKWIAKLADFGFAKGFTKDVDANVSTTSLGTPYYMAPEILNGKRRGYSEKADVWAAGVVLFEMVTLSKPFNGDDVDEVVHNIVYSPMDRVDRNGLSVELEALIYWMLEKNPANRPSIRQVLQVPFITDALEHFVLRFGDAARIAGNAVDRMYSSILIEHLDLVLEEDGSHRSSSKSQENIRSERRLKRQLSVWSEVRSRAWCDHQTRSRSVSKSREK